MSTMRELRQRLGWSQKRLAEEWGMAQSNISRMEAGQQKVDRRALLALRALLEENGQADTADA